MSVKSQENNMRRLADLLGQDLSYIWGEKESGPNGAKRTFLNVGRAFLRALAKDLGLRDAKITSNAAGIAVSGDCTLMGMWENGGIYVNIAQPACGGELVLCYRSIRHLRDYSGGYNHWVNLENLRSGNYEQLLLTLSSLRKSVEYSNNMHGIAA